MRIFSFIAAGAAFCALSVSAFADGPDTPQLSRTETKAVTGVTQTSSIGDGAMHLDLTKGYKFVPPADVPALLKTLNARAPSAQSLGAVVPDGKKAGAADYWAAFVSYDPIGHVPETGVDELGAITFIDSVKVARPAEPALQSFAVAPTYDAPSKTLLWGEQYASKSKSDYALRYETRLLGRSGVAGITMIAQPAQLEKVRAEGRAVRDMIAFNDGQRYSDFSGSTDRVSQYNLPGLIDGKVRAAPAEETPATAPAQPFAFSDVLPGGRYGWASYLAGGLLALMAVGGIANAITRGGRSRPGPPSDNA
jgi:uncharacterized membrane-anchored protein